MLWLVLKAAIKFAIPHPMWLSGIYWFCIYEQDAMVDFKILPQKAGTDR